jgi:hypothetical protein
MTYRIPRSDICMSDAMPFNQHWEARIPVPIEELGDLGTAFHSAFGSLLPGDQIEVCSFERVGGDWRRLLEIATFRIVEKTAERAEAVRVGKVFSVPEPMAKISETTVSQLVIVDVGKAFEVRDAAGNIIEQFVDKAQAEVFRDREMARGMKGVAGLSVKRVFGGKFNVIDSGGGVLGEFGNKAAAEAYISKAPAEPKAA